MAGFIKESVNVVSPLVPDDYRHAIAIGETGCGKTSGFILPNLKERIRNGNGIFAVDFKGTLGWQIKALAEKAGRLEDVIEVGVPWGECFDLLKGVDRTLFISMLKSSYEKDEIDFWISSALNLGGKVFDLLSTAQLLKELIGKELLYKEIKMYSLGVDSLSQILSSKDSLTTFTSRYQDFSLKWRLMFAENDSRLNLLSLRNQILVQEYIDSISKDISAISDFAKEIDDESPASGNGGVFFALRSMFGSMTTETFMGDEDMISWLEEGKVIIIRSDILDLTTSQLFMQYLFKRLMNRLGTKPVSLFIDEFQRVVSKESIPYVDVFREKKVELIAAIQNLRQLENKIGESRSDEFLGNIIHNYEFANRNENELTQFEYLQNNKLRRCHPLFIANKVLYGSQYKWQRIKGKDVYIKGKWIYVRHEKQRLCTVMNIANNTFQSYHYLDIGELMKRKKEGFIAV